MLDAEINNTLVFSGGGWNTLRGWSSLARDPQV